MTKLPTDACGPECTDLLGKPNGEKRHLFALEYASDCDLGRAYGAAGYAGKSRQAMHRVLTDVEVQASVRVHRRPVLQEAVDRQAAFREGLWRSGHANLFDIVCAQEPGSPAYTRLETLFTDGVETRDPETGEMTYRDASPQEMQRAIDAAARVRMKRPEELPVELQVLIDEFSEDPGRGIVKYKINRGEAKRLYAQVTGMIQQTITVEQAQAVAAEPIRRLRGELGPLIEAAASGELRTWVRGIAGRARADYAERGDQQRAAKWGALVAEGEGTAVEAEMCLVWLVRG